MVIGTLLPSIGPVSDRGVSAIALVLAMVLLLAAQALPIGVMCFLCILAQPLMGITEFPLRVRFLLGKLPVLFRDYGF